MTHLGDKRLEEAVGEDLVVAGLVVAGAHLEELARGDAQQLLGLVVEGRHPRAAAVVDDGHVQDVPVVALQRKRKRRGRERGK